jgi:hypothetical protein
LAAALIGLESTTGSSAGNSVSEQFSVGSDSSDMGID